MKPKINLSDYELNRVIEMAWEDRTTFDAIYTQFGLREAEVISIMRTSLKPSSFRLWRARVQGRATKHGAKSPVTDHRFKCTWQKPQTYNRITKRKRDNS